MSRALIDDALILKIHSASLSEAGWLDVIREVMALLGSESASMQVVGTSPSAAVQWGFVEGVDSSFWNDFVAHWVPYDAFRLGAQLSGRIRTGCVSVGEQLVDRRELIASAFYNDFLVKLNADRFVNICLAAPGSGSDFASALSFYRGLGKEAFSAEQVRVLDQLAPHLVVAARNFFQCRSLRVLDELRRDALDAVTAALFAVDTAGRLLLANRMGEELLRRERLLRLSGGVLGPGKAVSERDRLERALAQLRHGFGSILRLTDALGELEMLLTLAPASRAMPADHLGVAGLIWATPTAPDSSPARSIARLFALTPAEERLLRRLAEGDQLGEAASTLSVSVHTARNQLKSIFLKTGRCTQGQLLQLASRMAMIAPYAVEASR